MSSFFPKAFISTWINVQAESSKLSISTNSLLIIFDIRMKYEGKNICRFPTAHQIFGDSFWRILYTLEFGGYFDF